jgi:hypothetical protein
MRMGIYEPGQDDGIAEIVNLKLGALRLDA